MYPNRNRSQQTCLLIFIVSQCSINYFRAQSWSNFEIKKYCGYREYKVKGIKIKLLFSVSKQITRVLAILVQRKPLVQKTEVRKG